MGLSVTNRAGMVKQEEKNDARIPDNIDTAAVGRTA